ncbi:TrmH family RNA methyltransferase [Flagellimonas sp. S174]|uniref:TrmH family RNA methyltransferase n=1 Tax=Flagellimonas sp. S174 TaxID=3410790 RepID=UPI003BF4E69E
MVTKNQIKLVRSLQQKKYRNQQGLFVVEGLKTVREILKSELKTFGIFVDKESYKTDLGDLAVLVSSKVIAQMSGQANPSGVIGVFHIPELMDFSLEGWVVALDAIRDPGNLGTIIRLCDWFDIKHIICSKDTVDCYNPKVLQATMGSIARVDIRYLDLVDFFEKHPLTPIVGAFMNGNSLYKASFSGSGILIMGNEANGISKAIEDKVTHRIGIPQFGETTTESLNVASATAILLSEIKRG